MRICSADPDSLPPLSSPGPYVDFIARVQQKLHERGFDAGPINGLAGSKMQAALAQFQRANTLPASGMLDAQTLQELGVEPEPASSDGASTGASKALR